MTSSQSESPVVVEHDDVIDNNEGHATTTTNANTKNQDHDDDVIGGDQSGKDSRYSWVVLVASFVSLLLCIGTPLSFGVFFTVLYEDFKTTNEKAEVAAVGSIAYGTLNLIGPLSTMLYRKYGCRPVVVAGGFLSSFGLFCSFFARDLWYLYITYGFLGGFGFGLIFAPSLAILPEHFDSYKYFAVSFATVGSAIGTLIVPQIFRLFIEAYCWPGAMLMTSAIVLHVTVMGMLMRSRGTGASTKRPTVSRFSQETAGPSEPTKLPQQQQSTVWKQEKQLFKDPRFYLLCLDSALFGGSSYTMFVFVTSFGAVRGLDDFQAVSLVSVIGISNVIGRVAASVISQRPETNRQLFFTCLTLLCSVASFSTLFCHNLASFILCLTVYGVAYGGRISQMSAMLIDTFGVKKMAAVLGYYLFTGGIGALLIPIVSGKLADLYATSSGILFSASITLVDAVICAAVIILTSVHLRRQRADDIFAIED